MKAYITLLSTDEYLDGVLALYQSLKDVGSTYPLVVAVTPNIHPYAREIITKLKIEIIELEEFSFSEDCKRKMRVHGAPHWAYTAAKLQIFGLVQFEKIIFLDSDMLIIKNIDHLFDKPHLTAAIDSPMLFNENEKSHYQLNSGLLVIEPDKNIELSLKELSFTNLLPDQELIRKNYPNWVENENLHLPVTYNFFVAYWEKYYQSFVDVSDIYVLHFIGKNKPFHKNSIKRTIKTHYDYFENLYLSAITRALKSIS
jgi:alpha-N-acetylglucosamine transferase